MIPAGALYKGQQLANLARNEARGDVASPGGPAPLRIGKIVAKETEGAGYQVDLLGDDGTKTGDTLRDVHVVPPSTAALAAEDRVWLAWHHGREYVIVNSSGSTAASNALDNCGMVTE